MVTPPAVLDPRFGCVHVILAAMHQAAGAAIANTTIISHKLALSPKPSHPVVVATKERPCPQ